MCHLKRWSGVLIALILVFALVSTGLVQTVEPEDDAGQAEVYADKEYPEDEGELPIEPPPDESDKTEESWGEETEEGTSFPVGGFMFGISSLTFERILDCDTGEEIVPSEILSEFIFADEAEPPYDHEDLIGVRLEASGYWTEEVVNLMPMRIGFGFLQITMLVPEEPVICLEPVGSDADDIVYAGTDVQTYYVHVVEDLGNGRVKLSVPQGDGQAGTIVAKNSSGRTLTVCQYYVLRGTPTNVVEPAPAGTPVFDISGIVTAKKSQCVLTNNGMMHWTGKKWERIAEKECTYAYVYGDKKMYHFENGAWVADTKFGRCTYIIATNGLFHCIGTSKDGFSTWSKKRTGKPCQCYRAVNGLAHYNNNYEWEIVPEQECTYAYVYGPKVRRGTPTNIGMWHFTGGRWVHQSGWTQPQLYNCQYVYSLVSQKAYHYKGGKWYVVTPKTCTYILTRDQKTYHASGAVWWLYAPVDCQTVEFLTYGWQHYANGDWNVPKNGSFRLEVAKVTKAGNITKVTVKISQYDANTGEFRQVRSATYELLQNFTAGGANLYIREHPAHPDQYQLMMEDPKTHQHVPCATSQ